jgi:GxxExxY protein
MVESENELPYRIIGAAIETHKLLGPGLLETAYRECLCREFEIRELGFEKEKVVSVKYKGLAVVGYRADVVVEGKVILELKAVAKLENVFSAQLLSYLKASGLRLGLLINFNVETLVNGIVRIANNLNT